MNIKVATLSKDDSCWFGISLLDQLNSENLSSDVKEKWTKVCSFDLSRERALLTSKERDFGYDDDEYVLEMEQEYKKFIFIRSIHPGEKLPMSKEVDPFWHAHILNTRSYKRFVDECADGRFIHHRPTVNDQENMQLMFAYLNGTMVRYREYFGEPPRKFWKEDPTTACCYC